MLSPLIYITIDTRDFLQRGGILTQIILYHPGIHA